MSIKNILLPATIFAFLLGGNLAEAEEIKQKPAIERTLEQKTSRPKVEINFNYKTESEQKPLDYSASKTSFYSIEGTPVEKIIDNIGNNDINSYQELLDESQNLSESQKLTLASAIGNLLNTFNYDSNLQNIEVMSQDDFFYNLQNYLPVGVCKHLATHIERFLNDIGIKSAAVSGISGNGIGHVYDISKIENGMAIVDSYNILKTNTKNIEKTIEAYQKDKGITTFEHLFFEDAEFKYRLITKDGRKFLDFIEYNESSEPLKKALIDQVDPKTDLTITFNLEDYLKSFEANIKGFFAKIGEIRGNISSPLEKLTLSQIGFKRNFSILDAVNINPNLNFVYGNLSQDKKLENNRIIGINGDLIVATNNKKGFNLSSRIAGNAFSRNLSFDNIIFSDFVIGGGISYKLPIKNISIEPYVASQFTFFPKDIGTYNFALKPAELTGGIIFDIKSNNEKNISIDSYYLWRIWEQELGASMKIKGKYLGFEVGEYMTKSTYDFCPAKFGFNVGLTMDMKKLLINLNYSIDEINYDGEKENQSSLEVQAGLKF